MEDHIPNKTRQKSTIRQTDFWSLWDVVFHDNNSTLFTYSKKCYLQVVGYTGKAVVVVSCVTSDQPHRPHPHNLVGKEGCKKGVCTIHMNDDMTAAFPNLGIQCVKKKDIDESLSLRQQIRVDPFQSRC